MRIGEFGLFYPRIADFSDKFIGFEDLESTVVADQLKNFAPIPDSVCLEVRIIDRVINFRFALLGILVFRRLSGLQFQVFTPRSIAYRCSRTTNIDRSTEKVGSFQLCPAPRSTEKCVVW